MFPRESPGPFASLPDWLRFRRLSIYIMLSESDKIAAIESTTPTAALSFVANPDGVVSVAGLVVDTGIVFLGTEVVKFADGEEANGVFDINVFKIGDDEALAVTFGRLTSPDPPFAQLEKPM